MSGTRFALLDPFWVEDVAAAAVRKRVRERWERRRIATGGQTRLTVVSVSVRRPGRGVRVLAHPETVERCLTRPATAERLFAQIKKVGSDSHL